jgi:hypothetical protein
MEVSSTTKKKCNHEISRGMKAKTVNCKISDLRYFFFLFFKANSEPEGKRKSEL